MYDGTTFSHREPRTSFPHRGHWASLLTIVASLGGHRLFSISYKTSVIHNFLYTFSILTVPPVDTGQSIVGKVTRTIIVIGPFVIAIIIITFAVSSLVIVIILNIIIVISINPLSLWCKKYQLQTAMTLIDGYFFLTSNQLIIFLLRLITVFIVTISVNVSIQNHVTQPTISSFFFALLYICHCCSHCQNQNH